MAQVVKAPAFKPDYPGSILRTDMVEELLKVVASTCTLEHTAPPTPMKNTCNLKKKKRLHQN